MVTVPIGSFVMGSDRPSESPATKVTFDKAFALGKYEITRDQFAEFVNDAQYDIKPGCNLFNDPVTSDPTKSWKDPGFAQTGNHPVVCVDKKDAQAYVVWLAKKTGRRYFLPSEAKWEYAARANTITPFPWGDKADEACAQANVADLTFRKETKIRTVISCDDKSATTAPVGSYAPNAWGFNDMIGNVAEWTTDCWNPDYKTLKPDGAAVFTGTCDLSTMRGGSFNAATGVFRPGARGEPMKVAGTHLNWVGFRVAADLK